MARRMDRRVQRTRKLLRESMMALILEEGYDAISIQDITDKANLGRATFYLHFKDKDDLLLDLMDQFISEFLENVPQFSQDQWRLEDTKAITKLFDFAAEHYDLYRIMMISSGGITASRQLHQTIAENIKTCIQAEVTDLEAEPVVPAHFIANFFAGSLLTTIYWWLDQELPYSVEEMADMFLKINKLDRDALMGLAQPEQSLKREVKKRKRRKQSKEGNNPKINKKDIEELVDEEGVNEELPENASEGKVNQ
jgi:AcrR family transcriptional regulator